MSAGGIEVYIYISQSIVSTHKTLYTHLYGYVNVLLCYITSVLKELYWLKMYDIICFPLTHKAVNNTAPEYLVI